MRDYFYEADIISIGGNVVLKDRKGANIRYEIYYADLIYESVKIPVLYQKYRKGRGKIEYLLDETNREDIDMINERLDYDYENDINGIRKNIKRRVVYSVMGLVLYIISMTLGTMFGLRVFRGAAYLPCMTMVVICGLISIWISNLTDRIARD